MSAIHLKIVLAVVALSAVAASIAVACGGATQFQTVQTFEAEERVRISTATAEAMVAAGLDPDAVVSGGVAATFRAELAATQTAEAEAGGGSTGNGSGSGSGSGSDTSISTDVGAGAADFVPEVPDGPAQEGEAEVTITQGVFDPQVVKVKAGTTVIWENLSGAASSARAIDGQAEQWDTEAIWKSAFDRTVCCGQHTFTITGCHVYRSFFSNDQGVGAVCVVE